MPRASDTHPHQERELALSLGSIDDARVIDHPLVDALAIDRPVVQRLTSTYYDTADGALMAEGVVLRVRQTPRGLVQTIKAGGPKGAGLAARDEWETAVEDATPQWPVKLPGRLRKRLGNVAQLPIAPLFETVFTRTKQRLVTPGGDVVELAVDRGEIRAGNRSEPIAEVELELLSGRATGLFDLALGLLADLPLALSTISKGERGFLLAVGRRQQAIVAEPVRLEPKMTAGDAFHLLLPAAAGHAVTNTPCILDDTDPVEGLHQMRVGLRRLRAALDIFKLDLRKRDLRANKALLKPYLHALGPARDLDVFVDETLTPVVSELGADQNLRAFADAAGRCRERTRAVVADLLRQPAHSKAWLEFGHWMASDPIHHDRPITIFAAKVLDQRASIVRRAGRNIERRPIQALHDLRIDIKQLRYAAEFFASLYGQARAARTIKALRKAQDALGHLNDLAVSDEVIARIAAEPGNGGATLARGADLVRTWLRDRNDHRRAKAEQAFAAYGKLSPFWR